MAESSPGIGESSVQLLKPEPITKKNRASFAGPAAKIAGAALAAGLAFGVSTPDQGGLRPITVSAAGETPTPTPIPNPLDSQIEVQKTQTAALAATGTAVAKDRNDTATKQAILKAEQDKFNAISDQLAKATAQGPILPPPERTVAAQASQTADLAKRRSDQATKEAVYDATSTRVAQVATQTATAVAATATKASDIARATATESAIIKRDQERKKETTGMWKTLFVWLGVAGGVSGVGAAVKYREWFKGQVWNPVKKFFNF